MKVRMSDRRRAQLIWGGAIGLAVGVSVNLAILATGVGSDAPDASDPGPVNAVIYAIVPFVWVGLFAAMGTAIIMLRRLGTEGALPAGAATLLLINCALYPVYTLGFQSMPLGLAGNVFTAVLAAFAVGAAARPSPRAAALLVPVIIWVSLASVGLVAVMTGNRF